MKRLICSVMALFIAFSSSGCFSSMVYKDSRRKVALRKAIITNNQQAINAIKLGDDGVGIGINVLNMEALREQPFKQLGAAVLDALMVWGGYEGIKSLTSEGDNGDNGSSQESGRDSNQVTVNGDGNDVHVGDETTTNGQ